MRCVKLLVPLRFPCPNTLRSAIMRPMGKWVSALLAMGIASTSAWATDLKVGLSAVDITPEIGVPLGGYGSMGRRDLPWDVRNRHPYATFFKPSVGKLDPIRAKAIVLKKGNQKLLFLSLDVIGISRDFHEQLVENLATLSFEEREIIISATHTHSGPGAISKNFFWAIAAMDWFQPKVYQKLLAGIHRAVFEAEASLSKSDLFSLSFETSHLQINRRGKVGQFDPMANLLLIRDQKNVYRGALVNFAVHGTALKEDNLHFSADIPGAIERAMERKLFELNGRRGAPVVALFNGAQGDVAPIEDGPAQMGTLGGSFAMQFHQNLHAIKTVEPVWKIASAEVNLPKPRLNLKRCISPTAGRIKRIFAAFRLGLSRWLPRKTRIWSLKLGQNIRILSWPGEPTTSIGLRLKALARKKGVESPWIFGLTNDHLSYFTSSEEYEENTYEACVSLYGRHGSEKLIQSHLSLIRN